MGRGRRVATMVCTRCDGTGQVNERWPDPSEPSGWHRVEGTCPKCKGKGKV
jgi:DnaJ-class molecular chaperone